MTCPMCHGKANVLGCLGRLTWCRCRCCGTQFSKTKKARQPRPAKEKT